MTALPDGSGREPQWLLAEHRRLAGQVRAAQRATWLPLLVFAAVTFLAIPVYRLGPYGSTCRTVVAGPPQACIFYSTAGLLYWPLALVLAYVVIAVFYLRHARARGVGSRVLPYVLGGGVLAVLLGAATGWVTTHPPAGNADLLGVPVASVIRLASAALAIGLALLVLALVEHNRALLLVTVAYLALVLVRPADLGWTVRPLSPWFFLPRLVIDGGALLLAGLAFARIQRPRHQVPA